MSRLYRKVEELLYVIHLAERTSFKHIIALDDSGHDLSTSQGIHNAISAVNDAMLESRRSSDRMKRKLRARAESGTGHTGRRPYGYEEWELLQLAMARLRRAHFGGIQQGRKYLLTGLVYCGKCGQAMIGGAHKSFREEQSRPRYRCEKRVGVESTRCGNVSRLARAPAFSRYVRLVR
jgi:Recombinase zinc beta ribbon domain